ncbi:MAG: UvrD-helicase domain-containing protein, partial [Nitrospiraceae bacterium]
MALLHDRLERDRAATVSDRNIVVVAGAGTGKTTLLVDRIAALLLRRTDPLSISQIVALTFTNKAANELKLRLRDRLRAFLGFVTDRPPELATRRREWDQMKEWSMLYDLSKSRVDESAEKALQELETSQIGTIHSFAAHVLRLYPIDGLVDPAFHEDDGLVFNKHFNNEWTLWLRKELGPEGSHHDIWRAILPILSLEDLRELAVALAGELNPLHQLPIHSGGSDLPTVLQEWTQGIGETCHALLEDRARTTTLERMVATAGCVLQQFLDLGLQPDTGDWSASLARRIPKRTSTWSVEDYEQAKRCIRIAQAMTTASQHALVPVLQLLVPFVSDCRIRFAQNGYITFDGLLARARDLLRDNLTIRQELKRQFRALLVDEFQDTDPLQYELILYLAESLGNTSKDWRTVR